MCFAAEDDVCKEFVPNPLAKSGKMARKCKECFRDIQEHCRDAVKPEDVQRVVESNESMPSRVHDVAGPDGPALFLGGWKAAMNEKFMMEAKVGLVVNTAGGLQSIFPTFKPEAMYGKLGIKTVFLDWQDSEDQVVPPEDLAVAAEAITATLAEGRSVLVHCAQGRSRSSTVVVAWLSQAQGLPVDDALKFVQSKRNMAQPNDNFMTQLREWQKGAA